MSSKELKQYNGKCHCGKFTYHFDHAPLETFQPRKCNCSICTSRGYLCIYVKEVTFTSGSLNELTRYEFGSRKIPHFFCPVCGSTLLEIITFEDGVYGINLRNVEGVDLDGLTYTPFDGASMTL